MKIFSYTIYTKITEDLKTETTKDNHLLNCYIQHTNQNQLGVLLEQ